MNKQRVRITEKTFNAVKIMIAGGATMEEISEYLKIGRSTVYRIKSADSWDEYKAILAAISIKSKGDGKKRKEAETPEVNPKQEAKSSQVIVPWTMMQEVQKTNELLTLISKKLAFIVEQLA